MDEDDGTTTTTPDADRTEPFVAPADVDEWSGNGEVVQDAFHDGKEERTEGGVFPPSFGDGGVLVRMRRMSS